MRLCAAGQGMRAFAGRLNRGNSTLASQLDSPVIFVGGNGPARQNALLGPNKNFPFPGDVGIPQVGEALFKLGLYDFCSCFFS